MSYHQNEIILEKLYETYLEAGYSEKEAEEKAMLDFINMSS